jgi:hypothetical protein
VTAAEVLDNLKRRGALLRVEHGDIVISAPKGVLNADDRAALSVVKQELVELLRTEHRQQFGPLVEYAATRLPSVRMTVRETGDTKRDFDLINRIRQTIQEFQPGGNHIYLSIVTLERRRVIVEWRALAERELRLALARVLARVAMRHSTSHDSTKE